MHGIRRVCMKSFVWFGATVLLEKSVDVVVETDQAVGN